MILIAAFILIIFAAFSKNPVVGILQVTGAFAAGFAGELLIRQIGISIGKKK